MIQAFQKFSQSRIAKIFLAIVALSFMVFFGGGKWFQSGNFNGVIAEVGNIPISFYEVREKIQQHSQVFQAQSGETLTPEDLVQAGIPQMVLGHLINETLLTLEAERLGLAVSDEALRDHIHSIKTFQNQKGVFDRALFTQVLRASGLSEETFIAELRKELLREQLIEAISVGTFLPEEMLDRLFEAQYQQRQASMLIVSPKEMPLPATPSESVLEAFYKDHQKQFETQERRTLTAFLIEPDFIVKDIPVTEEEIKEAYESKPEIYGDKPLSEVRGSIVTDLRKEKASEKIHEIVQDVEDNIAGGSTYEELAPTITGAQVLKLDAIDVQGRDKEGNISSSLPQDPDLVKEILQTAFSLEEGMDNPFTQDQGGTYYTVRVDKIYPPAFEPFADIKQRILRVWQEMEQLKAAQAKAETYVKAFNQGDRKAALMTLLPNLSLAEPSHSIRDGVKGLVFSLRPGHAGMTLIPEGFAVVVLNTVIPPQPQIREEKMASFKEQVIKQYQNDLLVAYINALRVRTSVKINKEAFKALIGQ